MSAQPQTPVQDLESALFLYFEPIVTPAPGDPPLLEPRMPGGLTPTLHDYQQAFIDLHEYMRLRHSGNNGPIPATNTAVTVRWVVGSHAWNGPNSILIATADHNSGSTVNAENSGTLGTAYAVGAVSNVAGIVTGDATAEALGEAGAFGGFSPSGDDGGDARVGSPTTFAPRIGKALGGWAVMSGGGLGSGGDATTVTTGVNQSADVRGGQGDGPGGSAQARSVPSGGPSSGALLAVGGNVAGGYADAVTFDGYAEALGGNSANGAGADAQARSNSFNQGTALAVAGGGLTGGGDVIAVCAEDAIATAGDATAETKLGGTFTATATAGQAASGNHGIPEATGPTTGTITGPAGGQAQAF